MIESLPNVPPALILLVRELGHCSSWPDMRRRVRGMLRDLRDQSEAFELENSERKDVRDPLKFEVHLHGPLDLLSGDGCRAPECRIAASDRVARSFGLLADRVWITDLLTERFVDSSRMTNAKIDSVITDVIILSKLMPLVEAGIVRFRSPWIAACASCMGAFDSQLDTLALQITEEFLPAIRAERRPDGGHDVHFGACTDPPMVYAGPVPTGKSRRPPLRRIALPWIRNELRSTLWASREAAMTGGVVVSNSRVGLAGALRADGRSLSRRANVYLEPERGVVLPWVSELSAEQVLQLREEASSALPRLRETFHTAMSVSDGASAKTQQGWQDVIAELRQQAVEVRAELELKRRTGARFWKGTYGILGLGVSAYGVASEQIVPGAAGLLPMLQLLINHKAGHESETERLKQKPGFVLVKAQDILAHADS